MKKVWLPKALGEARSSYIELFFSFFYSTNASSSSSDRFVNGKTQSWVEEEAVIDKGDDDDFHLSMDFLSLEIERSGQSLPKVRYWSVFFGARGLNPNSARLLLLHVERILAIEAKT